MSARTFGIHHRTVVPENFDAEETDDAAQTDSPETPPVADARRR